jgi:hypothetical protein
VLGRVLIGLVRAYQVGISSWTPPSCRYTPSCSDYAIEAIEKHGGARGSWLAARRIGRCHPWGGHGYDPVPPTSDADSTGAIASGAMSDGDGLERAATR